MEHGWAGGRGEEAGEGEGKGVEVEKNWVRLDKRFLVKIPNEEASEWSVWVRNEDMCMGLAGTEGLSPWWQLLPENYGALTVYQVWCGEDSYSPWGLPGKAFVINCL